MRWSCASFILVSLKPLLASATATTAQTYTPVSYQIGPSPTIDGLQKYSGQPLTLTSTNPVLTLDYGSEVGGFPYVEIGSTSGAAVQIELKYSEPFDGLAQPYGDGPWLYCSGLMNSFRTETFNITGAGKIESFFLQGGLRWQSITLLTTGSSLTIQGAGLRASVTILPPDSLPGSFSASNDLYGSVWDLGARAVQAACVDAGSQPSTWEVSDQGALVRGQYPAVSALGNSFADYTLEFSTKIVQGGTGWRVAGGANGGYGAYFVLTSAGPALTSGDITPLPGNSIVAGYGFSIINQTILSSAPTRTYDVPLTVTDGEWYRITTAINATGYAISINGTKAVFVSSAEYQPYVNTGWGSPSVSEGTFGFGPFLNQAAYFRDVTVTAQNGTALYDNPFTSDEVYEEYAIATNQYSVCLDGAKRDREIWIGDFSHTARIIAASSGRFDFVQGVIGFEFNWQYPPGPAYGLVPIQAYPGAGKQYREAYYPSEFGETDYQLFFMLMLGDYFALTSDTALLGRHWAGVKLLVQTFAGRYLDPASGLLASPDASWFTAQGTQNATAPTALFAAALNELVPIAHALGDADSARSFANLSASLGAAVNAQLWSDDLGAYAFSLTEPGTSALLATAFTLRAGIASPAQAASSVARLADLFLQIGYADTSSAAAAVPSTTTQLSPNTQGFLLESLFLAHLRLNVSAAAVVPAVRDLAEVFWPAMFAQDQYTTGASWEYLYPDGSPGIGIFTSLSHPWGGAPTYVLSGYVLGVRPELVSAADPRYEWVFDPAWDVLQGLGLEWARGRVPLSGGGYIEAEWSVNVTSSSSSTDDDAAAAAAAAGSWARPNMQAAVVGNSNVTLNIKQRG